MPDAFLFDIGRVLVQFDFGLAFSRLAPLAAADMTVAEAGIRSLLTPLETGALSTADFISRSVDLLGGEVTPAAFEEAYCEIFTPHAPMEEAVAALAEKYPLFLFSNTSELHERFLLRDYGVFRHFRGGIFSWRAGAMKPDDAIYEQAIVLTGCPPDRIAYIDDLPANVAKGRRLGLITHHYDAAAHSEFERWLGFIGVAE